MGTYEFQQIVSLNLVNINMQFGIDGISIMFILLTTLLIPICILAS